MASNSAALSLLLFEVSVLKGQRWCATPFPIAEVFGAGSKFLETIGSLERLVLGLERGKSRMFRGKVILPSLLGLALILSLVSSAEARSWRLNFFGLHIYGYSPRSVVHGYSPRSGVDRRNVANVGETERASTGGGAVGALLDRLVRGCLQQASEFQSWPYEAIVQIASPDEAQRSALEALRASTTAAAERLSADCPRDEPAPSGERLVAAEQAIDTVTSSFATVEPPLRAFFAALDDEQKARLMRGLSSSGPQAREGDRRRERGERHSRRRGVSTPPETGKPTWGREFARTSSRRCVDGRYATSNAACASQKRSVWLFTNSLPVA